MKTSKLKYLIISTIFMILSLVYSPVVFAKREQASFCSNLANISSQMISNMQSKKHSKINTKNVELKNISKLRAESDLKRQEAYNKLYKNFSSQNQIAAIDQYKQTVQEAVDLRRQRTDLARQNFISGINTIISNHEVSISSSESKVITSVQAARDLANLRCLEGANPDEVKATFKQSLLSAKNDFFINKSSIEQEKGKMDILVENRKNEIEKAISEYKTTIEKARQALIDSLK